LVAGILGPAFSADAEDATQEVFLHAYRKLGSFRGDSRFSTWLYRLAYNRALDYRRRLVRRLDLPLDEEAAGGDLAPDDFPAGGLRRAAAPLGDTLARERARELHEKLSRLSQPQRTAVHLHYWLGCSIVEISELMNVKPATVKSHLFRARRALARRLKRDPQ
jgi:RNA polymerase sigma-70 factor (ECF subfamily)